MGQTFVVENRPGGNGIIGADAVAKAPADGYTLLFNASTFVTAPMTMKQVPYAIEQDFTPIALVAKAPLSVAIAKDLPVTDIKSLIAYAKAERDKTTFAVGSIGSAGHLATELLKRAGGIEYTVVPYKGTAPAFQDLLGGRIDGFIDPILGSLQYHKAGQLRVVAVTSATRTPNLPDVPTVAETIPGFEFYSWYGLWGPAKLPEDIRARLNAEVNKALASDMREKFTPQGLLLTPGSIDDFVEVPARRHGAIAEDHHRRQHSCRVRSSQHGAIAGLQVVVTGSSAGIGRAIAERLLALGCVGPRARSRAGDARRHRCFHPHDGRPADGAQTIAAARACAHADALVHAAGVLRVGDAGRARSRRRRADVARARRCRDPSCRCAGAGDGRARPRPRRADRQPRRAGHAGTRPVRRDQGRARGAGAKLGARGRRRRASRSTSCRRRPPRPRCSTIRPAPAVRRACRRWDA